MKLSSILQQNNQQSTNINVKDKFDTFGIHKHSVQTANFNYGLNINALKETFETYLNQGYQLSVQSNILDVYKNERYTTSNEFYEPTLKYVIQFTKDNEIIEYNNYVYNSTQSLAYQKIHIGDLGNLARRTITIVRSVIINLFNVASKYYDLDEDDQSFLQSLNDIPTMFSDVHNVNGKTYVNVELIDGQHAFIDNDGEIITPDQSQINVNELIERQTRQQEERERLNQERVEQAHQALINQLTEDQLSSIYTIIDLLGQPRNDETIELHARSLNYL